ncbi:hydrogenase-2 assembly chaperone [Budviciaceae bacterium CWB-B4]|uniref:Hydrogenase-2 assembly chaperone n=1 Tax=Limnobaculum xujianqingii TaxID=2738837 RepID=A0A9D7AM04_9GAMM|nr:hydrogenase-2 assembly chaperone [Limnobaculum xujianqingii]MBK5075007.1 hydrogenase-2 assembly chaperone [Limnobaculum xujianqingii]MBK5178350.1 hydrogenase-2 assembly chaperone [Limnobaculum xujianqingii]
MSDEIYGYAEEPTALVQRAFQDVADKAMHDLSFLHPNMPVYVSGFKLFEGQWVGCVITPWMLSALILPGPNQVWPLRTISEKLGLAMPYDNMTFTVGELEGVSQYLTCSLMSPLDHSLTPEQGVQLANDCARMLLSIPVSDPDAPAQLGRRALLLGRRNCSNA